MTTIDSLAQRGRRGLKRDIEGIPGTLGRLEDNGALTVPVSGVTNGVYVKLYDDPNNLVVAIDLKTNRTPGLGVRVHENTSGNYEVTSLDTSIVSIFLGDAAPSANIPPTKGAAVNALWESYQFKPGRIRALNGSDLQVWMERLPIAGGHLGDVGGDAATAVGTITSSKKAWIVISNDPTTNTLSFTKSTEYGLPVVMTRAIAEETTIPDGNIPIWAYLIRNGATYIPVQSQSPDTLFFVDLRPWLNTSTGSTSGLPQFGAGVIKTLASDVASAGSDRHLIIAAESGTTDTLAEITGLNVGDEVIIRADAGDTITIDHNNGGATDKILLYNATDFDLSGDITMKLVKIASGKVVQYVDENNGGGSGAPDDATYITASSHVDLSAEIVIPALAASPDILGRFGGGTADQEFDSGSSPFTWSSAPDTEDVNTTAKSHFYVKVSDTTERRGTYSWSPAGAFDIRSKLLIGVDSATSSINTVGLEVSASDGSVRALIQLVKNTTSYVVSSFTYASGSYTQRGSDLVINAMEAYVRITRDGSNNIGFYASTNGLLWHRLATQSHSMTVGKAGLRLSTDTAAVYEGLVDWIRSDV